MTDLDPMQELGRSNPVDDDHVPSASLARIRARIQETVMAEHQTETPRRHFTRGSRASIVVAGVTIATAAALIAFRPQAGAPVASPVGGGGGGGAAMCIRFEPAILAASDSAFAGTVSAVAGDQVTFDVATWYAGSGGATVTLTNAGLGDVAIVGAGSEFQVGAEWLISANDGLIVGCGYSVPADDPSAADWLAAF